VNDRSFDTIVRDATAGVSRRTSIMSLGAAGLMAALAGPLTADAAQVAADKKGRKNKKKNQNQQQPIAPPDLCAPQVEPCTLTLSNVCDGDPGCQDSIACCSHFATCDADGFFNCLIFTQS